MEDKIVEKKVIKMSYSSIDRCYKSAKFATLLGARKFIVKWVGEEWPEDAYPYMVSADGVGKVTVSGATWSELEGCLPIEKTVNPDDPYGLEAQEDEEYRKGY